MPTGWNGTLLLCQGTPQGRARLALVSAFLNVSPWGGTTIPSMYAYVGQEQGQYADYFTSGPFNALTFIVEGRSQIEAAAGGEGSGTVGVDFTRLLYESSYYEEVRALYNEAGLSLRSDLGTLARNANLKPAEPVLPPAADRVTPRWLPTSRRETDVETQMSSSTRVGSSRLLGRRGSAVESPAS